jgi:hypothetical protein
MMTINIATTQSLPQHLCNVSPKRVARGPVELVN